MTGFCDTVLFGDGRRHEPKDIKQMRQLFSEEFFQRFAMAYRNYEVPMLLLSCSLTLLCAFMGREGRDASSLTPSLKPPRGGLNHLFSSICAITRIPMKMLGGLIQSFAGIGIVCSLASDKGGFVQA